MIVVRMFQKVIVSLIIIAVLIIGPFGAVDGRIIGHNNNNNNSNNNHPQIITIATDHQHTVVVRKNDIPPPTPFHHRKLRMMNNSNKNVRGIPDQYIIVFTTEYTQEQQQQQQQQQQQLRTTDDGDPNSTSTSTSNQQQHFLLLGKIISLFKDHEEQRYSNNNSSTSSSSTSHKILYHHDDDDGAAATQPQTALSELMNSLHTKLQFVNQRINQEEQDTRNTTDPTTTTSINNSTSSTVEILHIYDDISFQGFAISNLKSKLLLQRILEDKDVAYIEQDSIIHAINTVGEDNSEGDDDVDTSANIVPWGLDRVDQRQLPLDNTTFTSGYYTGAGVHVYILDSGIRSTHSEFSIDNEDDNNTNDTNGTSTSRVICSMDIITGVEGNGCAEGSGHGTHVAGIVGGKTYGVAKDAVLHSVRILDENGNGKMSGVLDAINYVLRQKQNNPTKPIILNMSLGGGSSTTDSTALSDLIKVGATDYNVHFIVSAGNDFKWACLQSPANSEEAITVGASTEKDSLAPFSNWGACVDIIAPGTNIQSAWKGSDTATKYRSGTSMAAPFVAGVAALYLQMNPWLTPSRLRELLLQDAVENVVEIPLWALGQPNYLVNYSPTAM